MAGKRIGLAADLDSAGLGVECAIVGNFHGSAWIGGTAGFELYLETRQFTFVRQSQNRKASEITATSEALY